MDSGRSEYHNVDNIRKTLLAGATSLLIVAVLSGCGYSQLIPLPEGERYAKINAIKDELDYKSAGKVVKEGYDNGDGVFAPSYFAVTLRGENAFEILGNKLENSPNIICGSHIDTTYSCDANGVGVTLTRDSATSPNAHLRITDSMNGRDGR